MYRSTYINKLYIHVTKKMRPLQNVQADMTAALLGTCTAPLVATEIKKIKKR